MKRKSSLVTLLLLLVLSLTAFVGCEKSGGGNVRGATVLESSSTQLLIQVDDLEGDAVLYDVMNFLLEKNEIEFVSENSAYGQSIVSINGVENPADWSSYWASYTTDADNGTFAFERDGVEWYYAAAGISSLPAVEGESYLFEFVKNEY